MIISSCTFAGMTSVRVLSSFHNLHPLILHRTLSGTDRVSRKAAVVFISE